MRVIVFLLISSFVFFTSSWAQSPRMNKKQLRAALSQSQNEIDSLIYLTESLRYELKNTEMKLMSSQIGEKMANGQYDLILDQYRNYVKSTLKQKDSIQLLLFQLLQLRDSISQLKSGIMENNNNNHDIVYPVPFLFNNGSFGFVYPKSKTLAFSGTYEKAEPFNQYGLAVVGKNDRVGLINTRGEIVLPITHHKITAFKNGLAAAVTKSEGQGENIGEDLYDRYIDYYVYINP
ncbi:MAG: WG repeat-containing protein [Ferruginibacter sp.]